MFAHLGLLPSCAPDRRPDLNLCMTPIPPIPLPITHPIADHPLHRAISLHRCAYALRCAAPHGTALHCTIQHREINSLSAAALMLCCQNFPVHVKGRRRFQERSFGGEERQRRGRGCCLREGAVRDVQAVRRAQGVEVRGASPQRHRRRRAWA